MNVCTNNITMMQSESRNCTTPSATTTASKLNNDAVKLIDSNQYDMSIDKLTRALSEAKQELVASGATTTSISGGSKLLPTLDSLMLDTAVCSSPADKIGESHYYTCYRPITLSMLATNTTSEEYKEYTLMIQSAAIIFNLALTYQLQAATLTSTRRSSPLTKAVKLYEMAHNFAREISLLERTEVNPLFIMATINNMAIVYDSLHNDRASTCMLKHLLSTIMRLSDCGLIVSEIATSSQYDGFLRNVSPLVSKISVAPAA